MQYPVRVQIVDAPEDLVEERLDHVLGHVYYLLVHLRRPVELYYVLSGEWIIMIVFIKCQLLGFRGT